MEPLLSQERTETTNWCMWLSNPRRRCINRHYLVDAVATLQEWGKLWPQYNIVHCCLYKCMLKLPKLTIQVLKSCSSILKSSNVNCLQSTVFSRRRLLQAALQNYRKEWSGIKRGCDLMAAELSLGGAVTAILSELESFCMKREKKKSSKTSVCYWVALAKVLSNTAVHCGSTRGGVTPQTTVRSLHGYQLAQLATQNPTGPLWM